MRRSELPSQGTPTGESNGEVVEDLAVSTGGAVATADDRAHLWSGARRRLGRMHQEALLGSFLLLIVAAFALTVPQFATGDNFQNLGQQASVLAMLAIGQLIVILIGGIDVSVGGQVAILSILAVKLSHEVAVPLAFALTVLAGMGIGAVNGFIVAYLRVSPIIVTLGMWQVLLGLSLYWTQGLPATNYDSSYTALGTGHVLFLTSAAFVALAVAIGASFLLRRTRFGRYTYAIGGNALAAQLAGIRVRWVTMASYVLCSALTALGAITLSSRVASGSAILGTGLEIQAIAAVFVGGAAWGGGAGSVLGVIFGVLVLQTLANGFNLAGLSSELQTVVTGALIVLAVIAYGFKRRAR